MSVTEQDGGSLYEKLSPVERNSALRDLYIHFPKDVTDVEYFDPTTIDEITLSEKDKDSLELFIIMRRLAGNDRIHGIYDFVRSKRADNSEFRGILDVRIKNLLDLSVITDNYRSEIDDERGALAFIGAITIDEKPNPYLGVDADGKPGVFELQRAKELERQVYRSHEKISLSSVQHGMPPWPGLSAWRQEFIEKYGDEP